MMGFFEYCNKIGTQPYNYTRSEAFLVGAESRQGEIDELQKRIESITETLIDHLDYEYDELDCPSYDAMLYALREVKEILKGKENE